MLGMSLTNLCKSPRQWFNVIFINSSSNDDGTWRSDVFYNVLGTNYVNIALNAARSADSGAKLYINDYNIEYTGNYIITSFAGNA